MKHHKITLSLFFLILFFPSLCYGQHHNFVYIGSSSSDSVLIDKNIFKVGTYYRTWVRFIYRNTEEGQAEKNKLISLDEKFNNLYSTLTLEEFDISNQRIKNISTCYYDINDNLLESYTDVNPSWYFIVPNSIGEDEFRNVKSFANHKTPNKKRRK